MYTMTSFNKAMDDIQDMAADFYNQYDLILTTIFVFNDRYEVFWNYDNVEDVERLMEQLRQEGFDVHRAYAHIIISIKF